MYTLYCAELVTAVTLLSRSKKLRICSLYCCQYKQGSYEQENTEGRNTNGTGILMGEELLIQKTEVKKKSKLIEAR